MSDAPESTPFDRVVGPWEQVIEDMDATAEDYREAGWSVVTCHPGDVATLLRSGDVQPRREGLDVLVPGDEYEAIRDALEDSLIERVDVFRASDNAMVFLMLALECQGDLAVLIPAYYEQDDREALQRAAEERGLSVHVRPLSADEVVTVDLENPSLLFPD